jgi:AAA domain (dynein-related subfamily)/CbbQ/NirQ/NorQ C-terminal
MRDSKASYEKWVQLLVATGKSVVTIDDIRKIMEENDLKMPQWFTKDAAVRAGRGKYHVPFAPKIGGKPSLQFPQRKQTSTTEETVTPALNPTLETLTHPQKLRIASMTTDIEEQGIVPPIYKNYRPFGNFDDLKAIIASKQFYPVFITGPSGNGKSMSVEQACAKLGREFIPVPMTAETDEGDLLGNYVLINNEMVWRDGSVTVAARRGAVVCIDEVDYGAQNLSCLQRVLEGKPFLLKKKGEIITPAKGFQIIVTANTKGKGSEDGRYMFTNVLNESFLERFPITFEQEWAPNVIELKIVKGELEEAGRPDKEFAEHLVTWATVVRKAHDNEAALQEVISTRRLVHIARAYPIFNGDRLKCITYCLNRFDELTKRALIDLYTKLDATIVVENIMESTAAPVAPVFDPEEVNT